MDNKEIEKIRGLHISEIAEISVGSKSTDVEQLLHDICPHGSLQVLGRLG